MTENFGRGWNHGKPQWNGIERRRKPRDTKRHYMHNREAPTPYGYKGDLKRYGMLVHKIWCSILPIDLRLA